MPTERIQKILANAGVASRRASEALVAAGRVTIDGRRATIGAQVDPATAVIEVDGIPVGIGVARAYVAVHKPAGVTSTVQDRHATRTVLDLVPTALVPDGTRLYPVGRLDQDSEGLLFLTNDGDWAERVLHPRYGVARRYAVGLATPPTREQLRALSAGIPLEEGSARLAAPLEPLPAAAVAGLADVLAPPPDPRLTWYVATLRQGWKRQLRRMFGAVGAPIERLVRIGIGPVELGSLRSGRAKRLSPRDVDRLATGGPQRAETGGQRHRR